MVVAPSQCPSEAVDRAADGPAAVRSSVARAAVGSGNSKEAVFCSALSVGRQKMPPRLARFSLALPTKSGASFPSLSLTHSLARTEARNAAALRFAGGVGIHFPSEMSDIKHLLYPCLVGECTTFDVDQSGDAVDQAATSRTRDRGGGEAYEEESFLTFLMENIVSPISRTILHTSHRLP